MTRLTASLRPSQRHGFGDGSLAVGDAPQKQRVRCDAVYLGLHQRDALLLTGIETGSKSQLANTISGAAILYINTTGCS